ncbi:hypothetical protein J7I93_20610 [Bacillus sp. ISL-47]|uniref:hypothetical protein n=1 Tax=Bacillus sp. ISL-47 TaxID=2819130 RepID=UPI001BEBF539|nr:hypothetical protein [Bacillus sp. ISL-47]MBT2690562.1 hypothetical protein [Bacillus sp. ISL-47]MBT2710915.1 hypothetical protein [Pseudomonas sp. ISL-84]
MNRVSDREQTLESLLESLIKMLGRSNQRVDDLSKRVIQLEYLLRETVMQNGHSQEPPPSRRLTIMN